MKTIGDRIKTIRLSKGMSQVELSKKADISQPVLVRLESGAQLTTKKLSALARALNVKISDLDPAMSDEWQPRTPMPPPVKDDGHYHVGGYLAEALWFSEFTKNRTKEEIDRIKKTIEAAFSKK
jgi:transcriptional regulator with XRE-family HTH domain